MRLDQGSLIFKPLNGECPSWETALGQSHEGNGELPPYHFKAEGYENILKGLIFNSVPLNTVSCILGKTKEEVKADTSYLFTKTQEIQLAGKFEKVIVHFGDQEKSFVDAPFTLLLTKIQDGNKYHFGRRSIKYSPHTIADGVKNSDSFEKIQNRFGERLACYGLFVEHFDTLHLYCVSADTYYDKNNWKDFSLPETEWTDWVEWEKEERKNNPLQVYQKLASSSSKTFTPSQIIYYGDPGCGKSNAIKEKLKNVPDFNKVCVVFHPDYTNSEFIGQIRPKVRNHSVTYEFVAGPFAKILRRAYLNPNQEFYLVIDEINRGKASAILGEVFQLCDRIKPNDEKDEFGYGPGWSVYGVDHEDLNDYIRDIKSFANELHDDNDVPVEFAAEDGRGEVFAYKAIDINWPGFGEDGKLHFTENTAIRLPPNLSIFATMNTSDQNVFTLDNAFQRRFDMELVCNEFAKGSVDGFKTEAIRNQHNAKIAGTETTWGEFWEWANSKITQVLKGLSSTEDKRLGVWFICNVNGEIPEKVFTEKVLKYLWDDAFKFKRPQIFAEGCDTLENLISRFHEVKFEVFKNFGA